MRILIGLLLAGLLAFANAQAQTTQTEEANIADLASQVPAVTRDTPAETKPTQKTTQSVLQAVEAVVASLTPGGEAEKPAAAPSEHAAESTRVASPDAPTNEAETPTEDTNSDAIPETAEPETEATPEATEAEEQPEEKPANDNRFYKFLPSSVPEENPSHEVVPSKKELKAIAKYNEAVDQVAAILSERLKDMGPMPLVLNEETLLALDETEPEPEVTTPGSLRKNKNKKNKNKNKRRKNQKKKNQLEETRDDVEETNGNKRKNNNSNEKNNNSSDRSNEKNKGNKNSGEKNKNRNKNKNKRNKNKKNKKNSREDGVQRRQPKDYDDEDDMEETEEVVQGRRKNGNPQQANRNKNRKNKNRSNKKKNKKNKNKGNKKNKGRLDIESRENSEEPTIPTADERAASNAKLTGFSRIQRHGDVAVDVSGKRDEVSALIVMGPLEVQLKDKSRALTRAKVSTFMSAVAQFRVKSVRGRSKINLKEVTVSNLEPQHVAVTRDDLELEPELVSDAQTQVVQAVDIARIGRILKAELTNIFDKDNIVENLENHPFHKKN